MRQRDFAIFAYFGDIFGAAPAMDLSDKQQTKLHHSTESWEEYFSGCFVLLSKEVKKNKDIFSRFSRWLSSVENKAINVSLLLTLFAFSISTRTYIQFELPGFLPGANLAKIFGQLGHSREENERQGWPLPVGFCSCSSDWLAQSWTRHNFSVS